MIFPIYRHLPKNPENDVAINDQEVHKNTKYITLRQLFNCKKLCVCMIGEHNRDGVYFTGTRANSDKLNWKSIAAYSK